MAVKDHVITENVMLDAKLNLLAYDTKLTLDCTLINLTS